MANYVSNYILKVKSEGMKEAEGTSANINRNMTAAAQAADRVANKMPKTSAAMKSAQEVEGYGRARGTVGTGAASRDFANQAQGLGGLVRLYATFAANIFAVGAAFRALSAAMDTTNMVKGLDQIGVSSGQALGTLSKRLVEATDNAVSLREAMEATAKATSAGLSSQQVIRLGEAAKKASQALGLNMTDALSRLSRGVSKLEPELLDELGIYVKIDDATRKYAASLGRTASSLTEFERRQAFANEVLTQAEQKFGNIKIDSNPFTKLLATTTNLAQSGLELINNVLGPIARILSESPTALGLALAGIAATLLKQVVPALGEFRANARKAAEESRALANERSKAAAAAGVEGQKSRLTEESRTRLEALRKQIDLEKQLADQAADQKETDAAKYAERVAKVQQSVGKRSAEILAKASTDVTLKELAVLQTQAKRFETTAPEKAKAYNEAINAIKESQKEQQKYIELEKQHTRQLATATAEHEQALKRATSLRADYWSLEAAQQRSADAANKKAYSDRIAQQAGEVARIKGVKAAWQQLNAEIATAKKGTVSEEGFKVPNFGPITSGFTRLRGIISIATTAVDVFAGALSKAFFYVGIFTTAFQVLDSIFSTNKVASDEFSKSLDATREAGELASKVLEDISKKEPFNMLSVATARAVANALGEVSGSLDKLNKDFDTIIATSSGWDKFWDSLKTPFGKNLDQKFSKEFGFALSNGIKLIPEGPIRKETEDKIQQILNVKDVSIESLQKGIVKLPEETRSSIAKVLQSVIDNAKKQVKEGSSALEQVSESFKKAGEAYKNYITSLTPSDSLSKLAMDMLQAQSDLEKAFASPLNALSSLNDIIQDTNKLQLFTPEQIMALGGASKELKDLQTQYGQVQRDLLKARQELEKEQAKPRAPSTRGQQTGQYGEKIDRRAIWSTIPDMEKQGVVEPREATDSRLEELTKTVETLQTVSTTLVGTIKETVKKWEGTVTKQAQDAYRLLVRPIQVAQQQGAIDYAKALSAGLTGAGSAEVASAIKAEELDMRRKTNEINQSLLDSTLQANILQKEANALMRRDTASRQYMMLAEKDGKEEEASAALKEIELATKELAEVAELKSYRAGTTKFTKLSAGAQSSAVQIEAGRIGVAVEREKIANEEAVRKLNERLGIEKQNFDIKQRSAQLELDLKNVEMDRLRTATSMFSILDPMLLNQRQALEVAIEQEKQQKVLNELRFKEDQLTQRIASDISEAQKEGYRTALADLRTQISETERLYAVNRELADVKRQQEAITNAAAIAQRERDIVQDNLKTTQELNTIRLEGQKQYLDYLVQTGAVSAQTAAERQAQLATQQQLQQKNKELSDAEYDNAKKLADVETRKQKAFAAGPLSLDETIAIDRTARAEEDAQNQAYENRKKLIQATNEMKLEGIELTKQQAIEQAKLNDLTSSLGIIFGDLGTAIGGFVETLVKNNRAQEANSKAIIDNLKKQEEIYASGDTPGPELIAEEIRLQKDKTKLELDSNAKALGSAKKLFSEKTAAYKVLGTLEKAMHITRLALDAKELGVKLTNLSVGTAAKGAAETAETGMTFTGTIARLPAYAAEIYGKTIGQLGPIVGPAVATALIAYMFSLFGKGGGKGAFTPNAEQRQETQGTAMGWNDKGEKVQVRRGVFGDTDAKSESIANSLDRIKETSVDGLSYYNRMVDLLTSIDNGINKAAKGLYGIPGLRTGSMIGTIEGTQSGGGLLGTGVFGSKTSRTITDSGLLIEGTFAQLASDTNKAVIDFFEQVTVSKKSWYGKTKTWVETTRKEIDDATSEFFKDIFGNATKLFVEIGTKAGIDETAVTSVLAQFDVGEQFASLRGLKGEEFQTELSAIISTIMDDAAETIFSSFKDFAEFGEGMLETVIRVVDTNQKSLQALKNIGIDITAELSTAGVTFENQRKTWMGVITRSVTETVFDPEILQRRSFELTENLVKLAGGLDNFLSQADFFREKFLTEEERIAPVRAAVTEELERLGYGAVDTVEEFKNLVMGLDLTQEANHTTYQSLMNVAEGFYEVYGSTEETSKILSLRIALLQAEGYAYEAVLLQREEELKDLTEAEQILQRKVWAQEDLNKTTNLELQLLDAQGKSSAALAIRREQELRALKDSDKLIQQKIWAQQDADRLLTATNDIALRTLKAQGKDTEAATLQLSIQRAKERKEIENLDATLIPAIEKLYELEDAARALAEQQKFDDAARELTTRKLQLLNDSQALLNMQRDKERGEIAKINPALLTMLEEIYDLEDAASAAAKALSISTKAEDLNIRILRAQGKETEALAIERARERAEAVALDESLGYLVDQLFAAEDAALAAAKAQEIANAKLDQQIKIQELLGNSSEALRLTREREIEAADELLRPGLRYIHALEDEKNLKDKVKASYDKLKSSLQSTISSLRSSITTLKEYQNSLITSDNSPLSPAQKYAQLKQQAADVAAIATGIATTDAEKEAKARAIEQLPGVSDALLQMSRTLFASSDAYIKDFTWIQEILNSTITSAEAQLTDAQMQLNELEAQTGILGFIEENTSDTNSLLIEFGQNLREYTDALASVAITRAAYTSSVSGFARGGVAEGLAIVGEQGPELVDFNNPGRVYPAQQTAQILRQENLLEELRELRKEVAKLREEQNAQTGHLIQSNYDANARAAQQIVDGNSNLVKQQTWEAKSKATIR